MISWISTFVPVKVISKNQKHIFKLKLQRAECDRWKFHVMRSHFTCPCICALSIHGSIGSSQALISLNDSLNIYFRRTRKQLNTSFEYELYYYLYIRYKTLVCGVQRCSDNEIKVPYHGIDSYVWRIFDFWHSVIADNRSDQYDAIELVGR